DFVKDKGAGLVVNLFGPPRVSKAFSAEATSEQVRRPLCVIGGSDLARHSSASSTHRVYRRGAPFVSLSIFFSGLIRYALQADVFLEHRSLHDLKRNAMAAVFLRHVEYYRGILFLTTNHVQAFDEAFLSRIHVALHSGELSEASCAQVWRAFVAWTSTPITDGMPVDEAQIALLTKRAVNGTDQECDSTQSNCWDQ
ncbi:hypothetical protein B0H14DRAFT_2348192, partial [Mycena olivaceomarginata]